MYIYIHILYTDCICRVYKLYIYTYVYACHVPQLSSSLSMRAFLRVLCTILGTSFFFFGGGGDSLVRVFSFFFFCATLRPKNGLPRYSSRQSRKVGWAESTTLAAPGRNTWWDIFSHSADVRSIHWVWGDFVFLPQDRDGEQGGEVNESKGT